MAAEKTLRQRELELQDMIRTADGRAALEDLASTYSDLGGEFQGARASVITSILVYERTHGLLLP